VKTSPQTVILAENPVMAIRFCTANFPGVIQVQEDGSFKGHAASIFNQFRHSLLHIFPNVTLFTADQLGSMSADTQQLHGCLGRLQRNESDITYPIVKFPVKAPGLKQSSVLQSSKTVIVSAYNSNAGKLSIDVMDAFQSFSPQLWCLTIITACIITFVLYKIFKYENRQEERSIKQAGAILLANSLKQHSLYSCRSKQTSARLVIFWFAVYSFLILFYFSSMIKTEMVIQKEPETITTYDDVLGKSIRPLWARQTDDSEQFMRAAAGTKEARVWELANRLGLNNSFLHSDKDVERVIFDIMGRKSVWLAQSWMAVMFLTNFCPFIRAKDMFPNTNSLWKPDESTRETLMGLLYSANMDPVQGKKYYQLTQMMLEMGHSQISLKMIEFVASPYTGSRGERECLANRVIFPDQELHAVELPHYSRLFLVCSSLLLLLHFLLLFEHVLRA
jgi:hypothetical protein